MGGNLTKNNGNDAELNKSNKILKADKTQVTQDIIKRMTEVRGYDASIKEPIPDGNKWVNVGHADIHACGRSR